MLLAGVLAAAAPAADEELAQGFRDPPDSARPWVYCFWLDGNVTREGITADLEAMQRAGIGGALIMDVALGNPRGPVRFLSDEWRELFRHFVAESARLGLEVNMNNDPGWAGSGGPWVKPEQASRKVVVSETVAEGPARFDAVLAQPPTSHNSYRDIAVLAFPSPAADAGGKIRRIEGFQSSKSFGGGSDFAGCVVWPRFIPTSPAWPPVAKADCVPADKIQDLTGRMGPEGRLTWQVPAGRWIIQRIGHTVAGGVTRASPQEGTGLECDKLSKAAIEAHFAAMMEKLIGDVGPLAGKVLVSTHSDSWEAGSGNWTEGFRNEFLKRRQYDLLPYLPALGGVVVDSLEVSERFLWDFRQTVADLMLENYAGHLRELARRRGLRLSIEAYDGTCDDLRYAGRADEPMCEFWQGGMYGGMIPPDLPGEMASAAHVYGKRIVGAEAFTDWRGNWLSHPATLKPLGDWAFCEGVNRFVVAEWALQPWTNRWPGLCFSNIGTKYERTLTWWEQSKAWHQYLARCQFLLRQGLFAADVCFLEGEGAPSRFVAPIPAAIRSGALPGRPEYGFDGCPAEVVLTRMAVKDGRLVLPDGMNYRLLVLPSYNADGQPVLYLSEKTYAHEARPLPKIETMTPALLRKVKELVEAGATVLGTRPLKSPSLTGFPACDEDVTRLADELWGPGTGASGSGQRRVGKGRVVWGQTPEQVLREMGLPPDFRCGEGLPSPYRNIHRSLEDGTELYFVANTTDRTEDRLCSFRVAGKRPELWDPQTGRMEPALAFEEAGGCTQLPLRLEPAGSVFVVFRPVAAKRAEQIVSVTRDGRQLLPKAAGTQPASPAMDMQRGEVWSPGTYEVKTADGRSRRVTVSDLPAPMELTGPWKVSFDPNWGGPAEATFDQLIDWSKRPENGIKYYSGTATYHKTFHVPPCQIDKPRSRFYLDLGRVAVMAGVRLNGNDLGTLWKAPFRVEVTGALKAGENAMEVKVVNLWVNRMIGDEQLPEDSSRSPDGSLTQWPQWLLEGKPSPTGRFTFASRRWWKKDSPLVESGLLGPVTINVAEEIYLPREGAGAESPRDGSGQ